MRRRWKIVLFALVALVAAVGFDYAYVNYVRPKFALPQEAEEGPALILELTKENYFAEFGNPTAPTKVVAYLPDHACHNEAVKFLVETAKQSPNDLYLKLIRMRSAQGMEMLEREGKEVCARYEINGETTFNLSRPDGAVVPVSFKKAPEQGGWTPDALAMTVQQAIAEAKQGLVQKPAPPSTPPPPTEAPKTPPAHGTAPPQPPSSLPAAAPAQPGKPLVVQLLGEKAVGEWGKPTAPTKVVSYVPDSPCHDAYVAFLTDTAKKEPSRLYVKLIRMFTPEGGKITVAQRGHICAAYVINGSDTVTVTLPDGSTKEAVFQRSGFPLEELKLAVQQAMAKRSSRR